MTKIIRLEASNVKRLRAVEITPQGNVVVLGGNNAQGKSSVLDSIAYALAGKAAIPAEPIRKGERRAKVVLDLDDGLQVTRTFDASGSKLVVKDKHGDRKRSPQSLLNDLCGAIAFDPLEYSRMDPAKQAKVLRELVGLDTRILDAKRKELYDKRTDENRDVTRLRGQLAGLPVHEDAPAAEVSVAALMSELELGREQVAENDRARAEVSRAQADVRQHQNALEATRDEIAAIERRLHALRDTERHQENRLRDAQDELTRVSFTAAELVDPDLEPIREQLRTAEETNRKVRENAARAKVAAELQTAEGNVSFLTEEITKIDDRKASMLEDAAFPVPGLGFDEEDGVTFEGVPFEQASQAQRVRVSVAMGIAMNPTLRVLLIREASLLDDEAMAMVARMAEEADCQLWLERVGTRDEGAIIIEDGAIADARPEAAE